MVSRPPYQELQRQQTGFRDHGTKCESWLVREEGLGLGRVRGAGMGGMGVPFGES